MTVNELIKQLKNLPEEVRERPIMDGNPNDEYWLADLRAISVAKVVVSGDGACNMYDPVLSDEENIEELENRYDMSMHVEHRALAFFNWDRGRANGRAHSH